MIDIIDVYSQQAHRMSLGHLLQMYESETTPPPRAYNLINFDLSDTL